MPRKVGRHVNVMVTPRTWEAFKRKALDRRLELGDYVAWLVRQELGEEQLTLDTLSKLTRAKPATSTTGPKKPSTGRRKAPTASQAPAKRKPAVKARGAVANPSRKRSPAKAKANVRSTPPAARKQGRPTRRRSS